MTWFSELFGFDESAEAVERFIRTDGERLHSQANDRSFACGTLTTPTLSELTAQVAELDTPPAGRTTVREVVGDAGQLHGDPAHAGALFQVASQFNLLEMVSPRVTPADGITGYVHDRTQGPVCAMACAAGTLQRNWFAQRTDAQIDTLAGVGDAVGNEPDADGRGRFWEMRNGYALLTGEVPSALSGDPLATHPDLAIGLHANTEVTLGGAGHLVTQAYCSALPTAYSSVEAADVEPLARLVLNSAYQATLAAAAINAQRPGGSPLVFLTLVGGGVFGNPVEWIADAISRAVARFADHGLDVAIVSYGQPNPALERLLD